MPAAAERTEVRAAERIGAQAGAETGARTGEQPAGGAAERTGERVAGRNAESAADAGAFAETVARSVREPDGGGDLKPENAGWRDSVASDGVGGYGDVEAGAGLAMRGVGEDTPDANRNTVAEFAPAGRERVRPADGTARSGGAETAGRPPLPQRVGVVVCGRRTAYADFLLGYARERHMAARVDFIYELSPEDLPALFRLARTFVYLPDAEIEASIVPVVEALRAGLPMVLSDTRLNREAAGDAAVYVDPEAVGEVAAALENVLWDETFRSEMRRREGRRAELFSEYAVARRLIDIYSSL